MCTSEINLNNNEMIRAEVSPGKIGIGLFPNITTSNYQNDAQDDNSAQEGLSSEEEDLIAQSTFEIRNIIASKTRPTYMSRFTEMMMKTDSITAANSANPLKNNEQEDSFSSSQEGGAQQQPRRLRVFHDITQKSDGASGNALEVNMNFKTESEKTKS